MIEYCGHGGFILNDTAWEEGKPWLRPAAVDYIESHLPIKSKVFEWGSGASTIWLARHEYQVHSLELNYDWYPQILKRLQDEGIDHCVNLHYYGSIDQWDAPLSPSDMQMYADAVLCADIQDQDLILVDGRNRCRCLANARSRVKIGGLLCLDNSERTEYAKAVDLLTDWPGYSWGDEGWMTTVWTRPLGEIIPVVFPNEDA